MEQPVKKAAMEQPIKKAAVEQPIKTTDMTSQTSYEHNGRGFKNELYVHTGVSFFCLSGLVDGSRRFMSRKDRDAGHIGTGKTNDIISLTQ